MYISSIQRTKALQAQWFRRVNNQSWWFWSCSEMEPAAHPNEKRPIFLKARHRSQSGAKWDFKRSPALGVFYHICRGKLKFHEHIMANGTSAQCKFAVIKQESRSGVCTAARHGVSTSSLMTPDTTSFFVTTLAVNVPWPPLSPDIGAHWNYNTASAATLCGIIQRSPKLFNRKPLKPDHIQIQHVQ